MALGKVRAIPLNGKQGVGKFAIIDFEDFDKVSQQSWFLDGRYVRRSFHNQGKVTHEMLHRFILGDVPKGMVIDHVNGDIFDNRKENLRICSQAENSRNRAGVAKTSNYKGVCFAEYHGKWASVISRDGVTRHIGYFNTEVEAAKAYDYFARKVHGEFAFLNFPNTSSYNEIYEQLAKRRFKGVSYLKREKKYKASFVYKTKVYNVGYFHTQREAVAAYNEKVREVLQENAHLKLIMCEEEDFLYE